MSLVVIKIYSPSLSKSPQIVKVTHFPCSIGRAVKNEIILHDNGVSAKHALIEQTESGLVIKDCQSRNGIFFKGEKVDKIPLTHQLEIMLGHTRIQFFLEEWDSEATREIDYRELLNQDQRRIHFRNLVTYLYHLLLIIGLSGLEYYLNLGSNHQISFFVSSTLAWIFFAVIFSAIASLFSKLQNKNYRFLPLLFVSMKLCIILQSLRIFGGTIDFLIGDNWLRDSLSVVILFSLVFWFLYKWGMILFSKVKSFSIIKWVGSFLIVVFSLIFLFDQLDSDEKDNYDPNMIMGYPLFIQHREPGQFDHFFEELDLSVKIIGQSRKKILIKRQNKKNESEI